MLLPVHTVGVMDDKPTYENITATGAVESQDGTVADWAKLPHPLLETLSTRMINLSPQYQPRRFRHQLETTVHD